MNKQFGFSLIELLIVITIMGVLITLSIPAFRNFNEEQTVGNAVNMIKDDIQFGINKSAAGINGHWYGIALEADSSASSLNFTSYKNFEITPRNADDETVCAPNVFSLTTPPCSNSNHKQETTKEYPTGVKLDSITLLDNEANAIDYPSFIDVRFNQSPNSGQVIIGSTSTSSNLQAKIARAELVYKNGNHEKSLVIDGGNICDQMQTNESACDSDLTGGPKPSRVFIVER